MGFLFLLHWISPNLNHWGSVCALSATLVLNNSDSLMAKLFFAAGETPCFPIIVSNIVSDKGLCSITALPTSGIVSSLVKLIYTIKQTKNQEKITSQSKKQGDNN